MPDGVVETSPCLAGAHSGRFRCEGRRQCEGVRRRLAAPECDLGHGGSLASRRKARTRGRLCADVRAARNANIPQGAVRRARAQGQGPQRRITAREQAQGHRTRGGMGSHGSSGQHLAGKRLHVPVGSARRSRAQPVAVRDSGGRADGRAALFPAAMAGSAALHDGAAQRRGFTGGLQARADRLAAR